MKHHIAIALTAAALLIGGVAAPANAAPLPIGPINPINPATPTPRGPFTPAYFRNATVTLPTCKEIATARIFHLSAYRFSSPVDLSNPTTHTGYGSELLPVQAIIADGGHSCTFRVTGTKNELVISVAPISPYDRSVVLGQYLTNFGSSPSSIGGDNVYVGGVGASWHEVSFLLEDGVLVSGKVHSEGDFFPAVLQDVSDIVYGLNH
jgi:hypothetical protein